MHWFISPFLLLCITMHRTTSVTYDELKDAALTAHNNFRQNLANGLIDGSKGKLPRATSIPDLQYSSILASIAQEFANTCANGYSDTEKRTEAYGDKLGESISWRSDGLTLDTMKLSFQDWFDEAQSWSYGTSHGGCSPGKSCLQMTQAAWADTKFIGCAVADCSTTPIYVNGNPNMVYFTFLVCNYWKQGNVYMEYPYECIQGDAGCPVPAVDPKCPVVSGTGSWYMDASWTEDGTFKGRKSYTMAAYGWTFYLFHSGQQWMIFTEKDAKAVPFARCDEDDLLDCKWGGNYKTKNNCNAAMEVEEAEEYGCKNTKGEGSGVILMVVISGFVLIGVGNAMFCIYMKRRMSHGNLVKTMGVVLEEDEIEREVVLTQN